MLTFSLENSGGHTLKPEELKVLEGTHGTDPVGLQGGEVGLKKHTKKTFSHDKKE